MHNVVILIVFLFVAGCASPLSGPDIFKMAEVCRSQSEEGGQTSIVRVFGGKANEGFAGGQAFSRDKDQNYLIAGMTQGLGAYAGNTDLLLTKIGMSGEIRWVNTFGGPQKDIGMAFVPTADGGAIQAGDSYGHRHTATAYMLAGSHQQYLLLVKTDAQGAFQWHRLYLAHTANGVRPSNMYSVIQGTDGGYVFAGDIGMNPIGEEDSGGLYADVLLAKTDSSGQIEWARSYGTPGIDEALVSTSTPSGGYMLAGYYTPEPSEESADTLLLKVDASGQLEWARSFGSAGKNYAKSINPTTDGGYVIAGNSYALGAEQSEILLIKVDRFGTLEWARAYGTHGDERARSVQQMIEGGFIIVGKAATLGANQSDALIIKTDVNGNLSWAGKMRGLHEDEAFSVVETSLNSFTILGNTESYGTGKLDIFLLQLSRLNGSDNCIETVNLVQSSPELTVREPQLNVETLELELISDSLRKQERASFE